MAKLMRVLTPFVVLAAFPVFAQESTPPHQFTSAPPEVRYELVQSPLAAKAMYRLDKHTGIVYQIVKTKEDDSVWQEIPRRRHLLDKKIEGQVTYQLFTSGLAQRFTYLLNVNTGATWQLLETQDKWFVWSPIP